MIADERVGVEQCVDLTLPAELFADALRGGVPKPVAFCRRGGEFLERSRQYGGVLALQDAALAPILDQGLGCGDRRRDHAAAGRHRSHEDPGGGTRAAVGHNDDRGVLE